MSETKRVRLSALVGKKVQVKPSDKPGWLNLIADKKVVAQIMTDDLFDGDGNYFHNDLP